MNTRNRFAAMLVALALTVTSAWGATFNLFQPATGILKGNASTYVTTAAASSDVLALWTGTCNGASFLRGDGACSATLTGSGITFTVNDSGAGADRFRVVSDGGLLVGNPTGGSQGPGSLNASALYIDGEPVGISTGSVSSVGLSMPSVFSVTGSPVTSAGTLTATFASGQTANRVLATPDGSTGALSLRALVAGDIPALGANPSASVGLTAINGAATTYMRSDAAPAINQAISPTWTGTHLFQGSAPRIRFNSTGAGTDEKQWHLQNSSNGTVVLSTRTDADGTGTNVISISRTGTAPDAFTVNTDDFILNATTGTNFSNSSSTNTFAGPLVASNTSSFAQPATFTSSSGAINMSSVNPAIQWGETDQGTDGKNWNQIASSGSLQIQTRTDAGGAGAVPFSIARTGTVVDSVTLTATSGGSVSAVVGPSSISAISGLRTTAQLLNTDANPSLYLHETDAASNEKLYRLNPQAGDLQWSTRTDVNGTGETFFAINRTGTNVDSVAFAADDITLNGVSAADYARLTGAPNTFTQNQNINKADPRLCFYDSASDNTWFFRASTTDILRLYAVDGTGCTTTGASIPLSITASAGTTSLIALAATDVTVNGQSVCTEDGTNCPPTASLSAANTWSNTNTFSRGSGGNIVINNPNPGLDAKNTLIQTTAGGTFSIQTSTDAAPTTSVNSIMQVARSGTAISSVSFPDASAVVAGSSSVQGVGTLSTAPKIQALSTSAAPGISGARYSADASPFYLVLGKSRGASVGTNTVVQAGDELGRLEYAGADGTDLVTPAADIRVEVDGTPGSNDMPGRLVFRTTVDGASSTTERMRISNTGAHGFAGANFGAAGATLVSAGSGSPPAWGALDLADSDARTGTLPVANGGTGTTTSTGTGSVVLSASPTLTGTTTAATVAATAVTVGGSNVCRQNGTNCPTGAAVAFGVLAVSGSSCTLSGVYDSRNISGCTWNSAGSYQVNFTTSFTTRPSCTVTLFDNTAQMTRASGGSGTSIAVNTYALTNAAPITWTATNASFSITCMGG